MVRNSSTLRLTLIAGLWCIAGFAGGECAILAHNTRTNKHPRTGIRRNPAERPACRIRTRSLGLLPFWFRCPNKNGWRPNSGRAGKRRHHGGDAKAQRCRRGRRIGVDPARLAGLSGAARGLAGRFPTMGEAVPQSPASCGVNAAEIENSQRSARAGAGRGPPPCPRSLSTDQN